MAPRDSLFLLFGLPTWILVDGTWAALSQIALSAPEGFNISSFLMLALTTGNLFPLVIGHSLRQSSQEVLVNSIRLIQCTSLIAGVFMAFFWSYTIPIGEKLYSIPLYSLFFIVGSCSSSSNITHFMFISKYPPRATSLLSTGFGLGSLFAGSLALFQGLVLKSYGVSLMTYFLLLSMLYIPSIIAFSVLTSESLATSSVEYVEIRSKEISDSTSKDLYPRKSSNESEFFEDHKLIMVLQFIGASFGYGVVPSIISFACSKFEHRGLILLFATSLTSGLNPFFRILTEYVQFKTPIQLLTSTLILTCLALGLLICSLLPEGEAIYKGYGGILPAFLYISFNGLFGFTNTCIFRFYKTNVSSSCVQHAYRWGGLAMQSGALLGSVTTFSLIMTKVIQ